MKKKTIVNNLNNFCFQKKSNIHLTFHLHRISLFLKFHDETSSFFSPSPSFVTTDIRRTYPLPRPRDAWHRISGITLRKIVDVVNRTMFVIPANEGSIETAVHTHTHICIHTYIHTVNEGLREAGHRARCILIRIVQGNRQSVYEPLNFYPIMGLAATYVKQKFEFASLSRLPRLENVRLTNSFDESSIRAYA